MQRFFKASTAQTVTKIGSVLVQSAVIVGLNYFLHEKNNGSKQNPLSHSTDHPENNSTKISFGKS